jgi:LCP family protein required for cell wall assembly
LYLVEVDTKENKKKPILAIVLGVLLLIVVVGGIFVLANWNRSLGEPLGLPTRISGVISGLAGNSPDSIISGESGQTGVKPLPTEPVGEPICGDTKIMYLLAAGVDSTDPQYLYGLSDVIRVIRIDFVTPKVTVLTLPRDLEVQILDLIPSKQAEIYNAKLNQAYFYGGPGMGFYEGPGGGPGLLARTIAYNYDLYVDHYIAINMVAFEKIVNAVGGVDIALGEPVDCRPEGAEAIDPNNQLPDYFGVGVNHMDGARALTFVRCRARYGDIVRSEHQSMVLMAIKDKLTSPSLITSLPKLVSTMLDDVQTDLSMAQIQQLTCLLPQLEDDQIQFVRFPDEWLVQGWADIARVGRSFIWDIPKEKIVEFCDLFEADALPPQ